MKIQIRGINQVESKAGKTYWKVESDKGLMSVFDKPIVDKLYEAWRQGKEIEVDAKQSDDGKYVNIRGIINSEDMVGRIKPFEVKGEMEQEATRNYEATHPDAKISSPAQIERINKSMEADYKPSYYVSYAKDIFIGLLAMPTHEWIDNFDEKTKNQSKAYMDQAIELVKQAHKAFS